MLRKLLLTIFAGITSLIAIAQNIDSLKLSGTEIPAGYTTPAVLLCVTPHSSSFYDQSDMYETFLGKVVKKEFQSFQKKGDEGSILYFEFEKDFKGQAFLAGLLWGEATKPTKSEPDDFYAKGNILVIWSFNLKSDIRKISMEKVKTLLN